MNPFNTETGEQIARLLGELPTGGVALVAQALMRRYRKNVATALQLYGSTPAKREEVAELERRDLLADLTRLNGFATAAKGGVN